MEKTLKNKVIVNFGDSIFGNFRAPKDISSFIAHKTGATVYNLGFGGCHMATHFLKQFDRFGMFRIADAIVSGDFTLQNEAFDYEPIGEELPEYFVESNKLMQKIDFNKVDIITIAYGINDFTGGNKLEGNDKYDIKAFAGALRYSIEKIQKAFPHIKIVLCSQIYGVQFDENGKVKSDNGTITYRGYILEDFLNKTKEIANDYGLHYIDNYNNSGINAKTWNLCFTYPDGAHPLEFGRKLLADNISKELLSLYGE